MELSDNAGKAIIAGVVAVVLVAGYIFFKRSDTASQPFGAAPAGQIQQAMQQARQQQQQQPRSAPPGERGTGGSPGSSATGASPSASGSPPAR